VAVLGTFMNTTYINGVQGSLKLIPGFPKELLDAVSSSIQAAHAIAVMPQMPKIMGSLIIATANQSFVNGMTHAMLIGAVIMACSAVFVLITLPSRIKAPVEGEGEITPEQEGLHESQMLESVRAEYIQAQMNDGLEQVRLIIGGEDVSELSDKSIKDALWEYYFDVEQTIQWALGSFFSPQLQGLSS